MGRALTKRFAIQGGYINYVAGEKTFNQAITIGFSYIFSAEKLKRQRSEPQKISLRLSQQTKDWKWRE